MKSFLTHIRDEKAAREARSRENAQKALLVKSSEEHAANDPRGDVSKPYKTDMSREMGDFTGDSSSEETIEPVKPPKKKVTVKPAAKPKPRGSRSEGMSTTQVAAHLGVSQPTVSIQTQSAFEKIKSDPVLAQWAAARTARQVPSFTLDPIDATTPWKNIRDYSYRQHYRAHLAAHMKGERK